MITNDAAINGLIVVACAAFLGWRGYERGVISTLQRFISVLSGYIASYFFTETLADFLTKIFSLHGFKSYLVSAIVLLVGTGLIVSLLLSRLIEYLEEKGQEPAYVAGMITGALLGSFLGLLTVWLSSIAMDAIQLMAQNTVVISDRSTDPVRKIAGDMVGGAVAYAVENKIGHDSLTSDLVGQLAGDPVAVSQKILKISRSEELQQFFSDPTTRTLMQANNIGELQKQEAFQQLMKMPAATDFVTALGSSVTDSESMSQEERAAQLLTDMYQKAHRLRSDPRFIALSAKPEFQKMAQNPSPLAILSNPMLQELANILFSKKTSDDDGVDLHKSAVLLDQDYQSVDKPQWQQASPAPELPSEPDAAIEDPHVIYRWTDDQGQKHFSQMKPEVEYPLEIIKSQ